MASWFEPNHEDTIPTGWTFDFETETLEDGSSCAANKGIPLQSAKSFWDMDDFNNEDGVGDAAGHDDEDAYATTAIAQGWSFFASGSANRQNLEVDRDGLNMDDYIANTSSWWNNPTVVQTLFEHNCLSSQDTD